MLLSGYKIYSPIWQPLFDFRLTPVRPHSSLRKRAAVNHLNPYQIIAENLFGTLFLLFVTATTGILE